MFTIEDVKREYKRLDELTGNTIAEIPVIVNARLFRALGQHRCRRRGDTIIFQSIELSKLTMNASKEQFLDTIRHEYAHAMATRIDPYTSGHGALWKECCKKVGCRPSACTQFDEETNVVCNTLYKYAVTCSHCGSTSYFNRTNKIIKSIEQGTKMYRCARCKHEDLILKTLR